MRKFITCDNPVFFFEADGIGREQSELTLAFGSEVALWANRTPAVTPEYVAANRQSVLEFNRRCAHNARRFLYSRKEAPWLLEFATKPHHLRRLSWSNCLEPFKSKPLGST